MYSVPVCATATDESARRKRNKERRTIEPIAKIRRPHENGEFGDFLSIV
jgi:hypothetical protein